MNITCSKLKTSLIEATHPQTRIIEFFISLRTTRDRGITSILTDIRALAGVVTVSIIQPTRNLSDTEHVTLVKIKYAFGFSRKQNVIRELFFGIKEIHGVSILKLMKKRRRVMNTVSHRHGDEMSGEKY